MKKLVLITLLSAGYANAQSVVQSVNSGSLVAASSSVSVGEIVVVPDNPIQSQSGLIGILAQNGQLEIPELALSPEIVAYPNPTTSGISFKTELNLIGEKASVYDQSGKLVLQRLIGAGNTLGLDSLQSGIYLIQFENKKFNPFKIVKH